jgi:hypothetical protein
VLQFFPLGAAFVPRRVQLLPTGKIENWDILSFQPFLRHVADHHSWSPNLVVPLP